MRSLLILSLTFALAPTLIAKEPDHQKPIADELFTGPVPTLKIEVSPEGAETLRQYHQVIRQTRPERVDVKCTVREGDRVYTDVAVHLKGTYSFRDFDDKPSLTLNFDKYVPNRLFYGLSKIHLNNSVQDPSYLCEQFGRDMFLAQGLAAPRATPAMISLNGRPADCYVLVEGVNKSFIQRNFGAEAAKGNVYDGGSNGDLTKEDMNVVSGDHRDDRSDVEALIDATREADPARRLARLEQLLDVEQFINFAAIEALLVHWDGYTVGCNNYHAFHDAKRDKFVFLPHGMDQLYGKSSTPTLSITPMFRGSVARALFSIPEGRARFLRKVEELAAKGFAEDAIHAHMDKIAARLRPVLPGDQRAYLDDAVRTVKSGMTERAASIAEQLKKPPAPFAIAADGTPTRLTQWRFKPDMAYMASSSRSVTKERHVLLRIVGGGAGNTGASWRTTLLLEPGHYELSGLCRTRGLTDANSGAAGIMFRLSGETGVAGITVADDWTTITRAFDIRGLESVELVCEFRGPTASCEIDANTLQLTRKPLSPTQRLQKEERVLPRLAE